jgi:hypothetical protein
VGACQCMTARFFAKSLKVDLKRIRHPFRSDLCVRAGGRIPPASRV